MLIARRAKADLFVSIHADCVTDRQIAGASVYVLSVRGASSEAARWLAERENEADLKGGVQLDDKSSTLASVLLNLSQSATISESMTAARQVLGSLDRSVPVRKSEVQQAALRGAQVARHSLDAGRDGLHFRSRARSASCAAPAQPAQDRGCRSSAASAGYFRQHPPAGTLLRRRAQAASTDLVAGN